MSDEDEERDRFRPLALDQEETKSCFTEYSMSSSVIWRNELCTKWRSINPKTGLPMNVLGATVRVKSPGPIGRCNGSVISTLSVLSIRPKDESPEEQETAEGVPRGAANRAQGQHAHGQG
ncbi:protein LTV1 homolog [Culex pipiens pallens]|uniref:protein LTV1 homolog n=1 Tax=Culex pipiens pallens TaxID=42434 RepID=UPI0019530ADC|nr:protein LTV1 homolog [Culex pipiens pallens]XP_052567097.1 protein LTV1 homolog [Culex pipiens pallens]